MKPILWTWAAWVGAAVLGAGVGLTAGRSCGRQEIQDFPVHELYRQRLAGRGRQHGQGHGGHKDFADKVDLQVQVAGPNAQRQIQQINAMVQQGAQAIVVYPISPTALNAAVKNACDKGVMIIAYDADISEPCAYNVSINQEEAGTRDRRVAGQAPQRQGQYRRDHRRARNFRRHAAHEGGERSVRQTSGHQDRGRSGRHVEPGGRAHRTVEDSRDPHLGPDRRTVDAGRLLHREHDADRSRQEAGSVEALRRRRLERRAHPDAARRHRSRRRQRNLCSDGRAAHLLRLAALCRRLRLEARRGEARGQGRAEADHAAAADRHQRNDQILQGRHLGGDEGWLQRLPARARAESRLVRVDLLARNPGDRTCRPRSSDSPSPDPSDGAGDRDRRGRRMLRRESDRRGPSAMSDTQLRRLAIGDRRSGLRRAHFQGLWRDAGGRRCLLLDPRRQRPRPSRRERRRQIDDRQAALRPDASRRRSLPACSTRRRG